MSRACNKDTWRDALLEIHTKEQEEWKISDESLVQVPGCIPNNILESFQKDHIVKMPARVKYGKS